MFEHYTEAARRVIFFARYEASVYGSPVIESEHLVLGLLKEHEVLVTTALNVSTGDAIRKRIEAGFPVRARISTSAELPLSQEFKQILNYTAEEAERLQSKEIEPRHLVYGILCTDKWRGFKV